MSLRTLGWLIVVAGVTMIIGSAAFDQRWAQVSAGSTGGALAVVGLAIVIFSRSYKSADPTN
jgi:hypothetical protein